MPLSFASASELSALSGLAVAIAGRSRIGDVIIGKGVETGLPRGVAVREAVMKFLMAIGRAFGFGGRLGAGGEVIGFEGTGMEAGAETKGSEVFGKRAETEESDGSARVVVEAAVKMDATSSGFGNAFGCGGRSGAGASMKGSSCWTTIRTGGSMPGTASGSDTVAKMDATSSAFAGQMASRLAIL
jgi:hypothetical protein